ncbi:MAG: DM13 domain-containing protein [Kineosporiaceae bacterium]
MILKLVTKPVMAVIAAVLCLAVAGSLYWFQPWRLVTDTTVTESLSSVPSSRPGASADPGRPASDAVVVAEGSFVSHEHETRGTARLVRRADGGHQLELVGLVTSDGPDLRVWLTDQPVAPGGAGWRAFDDGKHVELGRLKGNRGNQVYPLEAGVDLDHVRSVTIWCSRFSVSFGAAALVA